MKLFGMNEGYTLVELVIVVALSAIFLLLALQNIGPRRDFSTFQANVEKLKSTIRSAQGQGRTGRGDDHNTVCDTAACTLSQSGFSVNGSVLCGTSLVLTTDGHYQYYRLNAAQTRKSGSGFSDNPIADTAGPLYPFGMIGGQQSLPSGTTLTFSQVGLSTPFAGDLHLYFVGPVTAQATGGELAYDNNNDPILSSPNNGTIPGNPGNNADPISPSPNSFSCDDLVTQSADATRIGNQAVTIDVRSNNNHHATITLDPETGLVTSTVDR